VIGHVKGEHRLGRNYLSGSRGDGINAVLAAVGYNFGLLLRWLALLCVLIQLLLTAAPNRAIRPQFA
jgi:IS5 family transposase